MYSSITPRRSRSSLGEVVCTTMPGSHGVVQEAGVPFLPSISTRQRRHDPNGSSESVAQSFGIGIPASLAARRTEVPAGTQTSWPSTLTVIVSLPTLAGVP